MPRIYVACLASYNAGTLHGTWIDLDTVTDADDVHAEIAAMLKLSKEPFAEEWSIHDYEGFGEIRLDENPDLDAVVALADLMAEHDEELICGLVRAAPHTDLADSVTWAKEAMEEHYQGAHSSLEAWAENYIDDTGMLADAPEALKTYFDYERFARDAELSGDVMTVEVGGKVHVFDGHF